MNRKKPIVPWSSLNLETGKVNIRKLNNFVDPKSNSPSLLSDHCQSDHHDDCSGGRGAGVLACWCQCHEPQDQHEEEIESTQLLIEARDVLVALLENAEIDALNEPSLKPVNKRARTLLAKLDRIVDGPWILDGEPIDIEEFIGVNCNQDSEVSETQIRAMKPGDEKTFGGGAAPVFVLRRQR